MCKQAIIIEKLTKFYPSTDLEKQKTALDEISLTIQKGKIFGLLGPNGAGKSSIINILAGTTNKTSGVVKIDSVDIDKQPKLARSLIGIVPQEIVVDSFFTIRESLEFAAGYYGIKPKDRQSDKILKILDLYEKKDKLPKELSGGMKRRFLVAKAIVHSPKILILDEPTAGVDVELRSNLWKYIKTLNQKGHTIIITTHYLAEAEELCDEIAFINHGQILYRDTKEKLLKKFGSKYIDVEFTQKISHNIQGQHNNAKYSLVEDNKIRFNISTEDDINDILNIILSLNIKIKDIQVINPNLDDIFFKIIK
ncbi:ABC transporter ATP-binding protein [Rickettsia endosymbiont of Cardiosporidium cionae]|uniref:ABC transporter ATP-binding protein n=1 Tax=Rickettsia endosymbiont of Cardiosporidium cionae TaxID=2777155 RepID=UPI001894E9DC|nr:ABC transporter ATP-binding protein [Rickettsia endosymbiont of Cardiosporidium cionae]KAF8818871.1 putative ABC transporter ATP-binding protein YadG [Rickettsia endosymbiont of Cardiosporidium cionae]